MMIKEAARVVSFRESLIREQSRKAAAHRAINLAQGFPDFPCAESLKDFASRSIAMDANQYSPTWGLESLREAIARKAGAFNGIHADPASEVTVVCGSTEGMVCAFLGLVEPGAEVLLFEPTYENYIPDSLLAGAKARYIRLREPDWSIDFDELESHFNDRTAAIILNSPHNPTGKVLTRRELEHISRLCQKWDALVFSDEIYEHILYDGARHISPASIPGLEDRTVTISSASKTFGVTGWRVGWVIAHRSLMAAIRKVHDFLTVCAATPLQEAVGMALREDRGYFESQRNEYENRRSILLEGLTRVGFNCRPPEGAYYILADAAEILAAHPGAADDMGLADYLVRTLGVAAVPGRAFYTGRNGGRDKLRFCFCKRAETLEEAVRRLEPLAGLTQRRREIKAPTALI